MSSHAFPDAVLDAIRCPDAALDVIGFGVPCLRPFKGITLLQLIPKDHIRPRRTCVGSFMRRSFWCFSWPRESHVLVNPGSSLETLITLTADDNIREELQNIVDVPREFEAARPLNREQLSSLKAGFLGSIPLADSSLANVGLKGISDDGWELSFGNGKVTKRDLPQLLLSAILERPEAQWDIVFPFAEVVTAIYAVSGELALTGDAKAVTIDGVDLQPTTVPTVISEGWQYTVTETRNVVVAEAPQKPVVAEDTEKYDKAEDQEKNVVAEDNAPEWIIAIECLKVEPVQLLQP